MKKLYTFVFIGLMGMGVQAQIINIPDAALKTLLVSTNCANLSLTQPFVYVDVDTNDDGEIEVSEALAVLHLKILGSNAITLTGLEYFTNVKSLHIAGNNQLSSFAPMEGWTSLESMNCGSNALIATFNADQLINLNSFIAPYNTQFQSLDFSQTALDHFDLSYCSQLASLNIKNGIISQCNVGPDYACQEWWDSFALVNVCADDGEMTNSDGYTLPSWWLGVLSSYCTFSPGGEYNTVTGNIAYDCNGSPHHISNVPITIADGSTSGSTFSNSGGNYNFFTAATGSFSITPTYINNYFTLSPATYNITFTTSGNTEIVNFCVVPDGIHPDLEISIIPIDVARPGFDSKYKLVYTNKGTETQTGIVNFTHDDTILDVVSANPALASQSANNLTWNFTNLLPFESREIMLTLNVNSPQETPAVNIDDVLHFTASVDGLTDETPNDNTATLHQTVVGSLDPNDKLVAQGASITPEQLGDYLHYTIRFQNTGTFAAENVVVKDILANNFDLHSLQIIGASHPFRSTLTQTNKLEFFFENINLPPLATDEPGSHGYVTFKIKPKNTVVLGNTLTNSAAIYFDFNFPIVTAPVSTVVSLLGVENYTSGNAFSIYPNPVDGVLNIQANSKIRSFEICNSIGHTILKAVETNVMDVSNLAAGIYFIKIKTLKGQSTQKFIKL